MKKLISGIREFQSDYFDKNRALFEQLGQGQEPRVLFITCSDSRIDPNLITQTDPGDLFVIRNAGNIVPPYGAANGGEGASIEYAIHALNIDQIIICGHNHCGAMKGLLKLNELQAEMPLVYDWLKHTEATRRLVTENYAQYKGEELLAITVAENILTQIENLKTYPVVRSRLHQGRLDIYGWVYEIETGEILAYNPSTHSFVAPHTQLYPEDAGYRYQPGSYVHTYAPPVDVAQHRELKTSEPVVPVTTRQPAKSPSSWLSAEQVDRIYRGSQAKK
jgi:carbonic anhydrase